MPEIANLVFVESNELKYTLLGIMSGTSLDGLDMSLCQFDYTNSIWTYKILKSKTIEYEPSFKEKLKRLESCSGNDLWNGHIELGQHFGRLAADFIGSYPIKPQAIASHGHTLFHKPNLGYTFQAGHGQEIANATQFNTICDFRQKDISLGGQGAPLVPIGDLLLFTEYEACLNLGGFANISLKNNSGIVAFDICPVNYVLNSLTQKLGLEYDESGNLARSGTIDQELLAILDTLPYYQKPLPKSLGREWVEQNIFPALNSWSGSLEDKLRTFTEHIANQIVVNLPNKGKTLVSGGGSFNSYLIQLISDKTTNSIELANEELINFKEAMIFAFLGALYLSGQNNCLSSVTGATKDSIGGILFTP
ncbi:MAG: anhydro-N-acetylmuramic acid kinase [Crocinitomicaceae bacterium]|nr:anhydro-N-acetylmuramic acid kinase [Crocinitomicaceae bacterium]|tara:strand:- start:1522 stop:2613 length:1092 start_codon:yes stop_codon:yes gene_type:complete